MRNIESPLDANRLVQISSLIAPTPSDDDDEATSDVSGLAVDGAIADGGPMVDLPAADGPAGADTPANKKSSDEA
jgi:hypothetical protein